MSVSNLFKKMGLRWTPDADSVGAPEGALLRADNLVPDAVGALVLRNGSEKIYDSLVGNDVKSVHTVELADGTTYRATGVTDTVYINGTEAVNTVNGTGDIAFGNDGYQMFMARGTTKKKYGPEPAAGNTNYQIYDWGVAAPSGRPTLTALASIQKTVAALDGEDNPAPTVIEGTGTIGAAANYAGTASEATELTVAAGTARGCIERLWTSDQDYFNINGEEGSASDIFDMYVKFTDPARVEKVHVVFGCDNSSTLPFNTDRFEFSFDLTKSASVELRDTEAEGYSVYEQAVSGVLNKVDPKDATSVITPRKAKKRAKDVGNKRTPKSGPRPDANVWFHLSVTRGQFKRFGSTSGRDWTTVRGFRIIVDNQKGYTGAGYTTTLSDAIFIGGGERAFTGKYKCVIRAARTLDTYTELSPPSAESTEINLNHQVLQVTIPAATLTTLDPQADQIWVYLFGGLLDTWYRFSITGTTPQTGMTLDELTTPDGSDFDDADERSRLTSHGMTMQAGSASFDLVTTIGKSELTALLENEKIDPYTSGPPDNIVAIAGPWNGRMFAMTSEGYVYPSSNRTPSSFGSLHVIDLTKYGNPLWMVKTGNGIVCGCEKDIILLAGSGDDSDDLTYIDLYPQPMNIGNPPIDACATVNGNTVIYRSADGLMGLEGGNAAPFPVEGISRLWRGQTCHTIQGLNITTGRFRCAIDNFLFYILAPEGSDTSGNVIYRYSKEGGWSRLMYPLVDEFLSIYTEPSGALVAGDNDGNLWQLDTGAQDSGSDIQVRLLTPIVDGGNPLVNKEAHDFQIHCDTAGDTGTLTLYKNGSANPETTTYTFATNNPSVYRHNMNAFGRFLKAQLEFTGSFSRLSISHFDMTYRTRPQQAMKLDTGYILPDEPGDIIWLQEVEFDANAFGDVTMELWREDALYNSQNITVTDGVRKPYRLVLPREAKAYRPRIVFYSTDSAGEGDVGFECYSVRVRTRSSGNKGDNPYRQIYPVGNAP
jgi:hypothetical protein